MHRTKVGEKRGWRRSSRNAGTILATQTMLTKVGGAVAFGRNKLPWKKNQHHQTRRAANESPLLHS